MLWRTHKTELKGEVSATIDKRSMKRLKKLILLMLQFAEIENTVSPEHDTALANAARK